MSALSRTNDKLRTRSLFPGTLFPADFFDFSWPAGFFNGDGFSEAWLPAANLKENDKSYTVELSVPGYTKKDIHVEVDDRNILTISGERKEESKKEKGDYTRREFSYGSFSRSFDLPEIVDEAKIEAKCTDGVLVIELPKSEKAIAQKKVKEIQIS